MQMNLGCLASAVTPATTPRSISSAAATVSSSTLAAATLSAGIQSILPRYRLCSLSFCKLIPEDFLEFITGNIATPEECTAFHVVIVREMVDDMSPGHNLGLVDFEARKHVRGIINAIDPYQGVFPPHTKSGIPPFACEGSQISRSLDLAEQPFLAGTNIPVSYTHLTLPTIYSV